MKFRVTRTTGARMPDVAFDTMKQFAAWQDYLLDGYERAKARDDDALQWRIEIYNDYRE